MAQMMRGRGAAAVRRASGSGPSSGEQGEKNGVPASLDQLKEYLYSLTVGNFEKFGEKFGMMARSYLIEKPNETNSVAAMILEAATSSKDTTRLGVMVCRAIIYPHSLPEGQESAAKLFRNTIIALLHEKYEDKKQIRKKSIESWLAVFSFLSDFYHYLHPASGKALSLIGQTILEACKFMLYSNDCDDDEIECICWHLKNSGKLLEEESALNVENLMSELRTRIISKKTTERARCLCMDLIEYRARGYCDPDNKISDFYLVALQDAVANDELEY